MAYASWSVVFGEQPSAAKWNILGTNDSTFNTLLGTYGVRNPYCFRAYASGNTTLTDNTPVKISLATESYDYNNNFASSTYTAPVNGVYHFDGCVTHASVSSAPVGAYTAIYKNGGAVLYGGRYAGSSSILLGISVSGDVLLAANDTVEMYHQQDSGGNELAIADETATYFSGHLVHAV